MKFKDKLFVPLLSIPIENRLEWIKSFLSQAYELFNTAVQTFNPKESKDGRKETKFEQFVAEQLINSDSVNVHKLKESLKKYITGVYHENAKKRKEAKEEAAFLYFTNPNECTVRRLLAELESPPAEFKQTPALERRKFDNGLFKAVSYVFPEIRFVFGVNDVLQCCAAPSESGQRQPDFKALASDIKAFRSNSEKFIDIIRHVLLKDGGKAATASAEPVVIAAAKAGEAGAKSALENEEHSSLPNSENCWSAFSTIGELKEMLPKLASILIKTILSQNGLGDEVFFVACDEHIEEFQEMRDQLNANEVNEETWNSVQKFDQDRLWLDAYTKISKKPSDYGSSSSVPVIGGVVCHSSDGGGGDGGGGDGGGGDGGDGDGGGGGEGYGDSDGGDADDAAAQDKIRNSQQNTANKHSTINEIRRLHRDIRLQMEKCLKFDCPKMYPKGTDIQALETFKFCLQDEWFRMVGIYLCLWCTNCVLQCGLWCNSCFNDVTSFRSKFLIWSGY
jgi:hypothetical protein